MHTNRLISQLRSLRPPSLPLLIPQQPPQDLATGALGYGIDKLNPPLEPLVVCLVVLDMLVDFGHDLITLPRGHRVWDYNKCLGNFAVAFIGNRDDGTIVDDRVSEEVRLELGGSDLVALEWRLITMLEPVHRQANVGERAGIP